MPNILTTAIKKGRRALAGSGIIAPERMRPLVSMRQALTDPALFGVSADMQGPSWGIWKTLMIAAMGEKLSSAERELFKRFSGGRDHEPNERVDEFWGIVGRRSGKSRSAAVLAAYVGGLCEHKGLAPGERGKVIVIAQNRDTASVIFRYVEALFDETPMLAGLIVSRTVESLSLANGADVEVRSASFRGIRGITALAVIADETAFWFTEGDNSSNSDSEILNAVRPALATTGGPLITISSPHGQSGEVYRAFKENFGPQGDPRILVVNASSRTFNPTLPQEVVARALKRDPEKTQAEYLGRFRTDVTNFLTREVLDAAVVPGRHEIPPRVGTEYVAFVDAAGGTGGDSMTLAIAHRMGDYAVLDLVREVRPPFSPASTVVDFANDVKRYGCGFVLGDRWSGDVIPEQFRAQGIGYTQSDKTKSDLYMEILPLFNSGMVELLDNERLVSQFSNLERKVARGGKSSVDHPEGKGPGCHDDLCNAATGALVNVTAFADRSVGLAMLTSYGAKIVHEDGSIEQFFDDPDLSKPQRAPAGCVVDQRGEVHFDRLHFEGLRTAENSRPQFTDER